MKQSTSFLSPNDFLLQHYKRVYYEVLLSGQDPDKFLSRKIDPKQPKREVVDTDPDYKELKTIL
jgi:hypothetical protein